MGLFKTLNLNCSFLFLTGRSLNVKKNDAIKESTESNTIEDEDSKGNCDIIA